MSDDSHDRHPKKRRVILLRRLGEGATRRGACGAANICRASFYKWLKNDPGFKVNVEFAEAKAEDFWVDELRACAMKARDDPKYLAALIFLTKSRFGFRDHGIDVNAPLDDDDESNQFTYQAVDGTAEAEKAEA